MTKSKNTKRALLASILSIMLCMAMLIGSTFAWFTDNVTSGKNKIVAGNLDIELNYKNVKMAADGENFAEVLPTTENLFVNSEGNDIRWEPGAAAVTYLELKNAGNLALKYQLSVDAKDTVVGSDGAALSRVLKTAVVEITEAEVGTYDRATAVQKAKAADAESILGYKKPGEMTEQGQVKYLAMIVYFPEEIGNTYEGAVYNRSDVALEIELSLNLVATQMPYEKDSFGENYDKDAPALSYEVTPDNIQEYLNGEHGSMSNAKLVLAPGNYDQLVIGAPDKYSESDTVYTCMNGNGHSNTPVSFTDAEAFKAHMEEGYHYTPYYTRTIDNLTLVGQEGVAVAGLSISSGHVYGDSIFDPVRETTASGSRYYLTQKLSNITFENITFTARTNIETSNANTVIDGVTFDGCSFNIDNISAGNQGLRYYNENNNGNLRNLTVTNCKFTNCYQGVLAAHIVGVSVTNCEFDTTTHNAIQLTGQSPVNHKAVVIENNTFNNIGDRIIRFNDVGSDTQITIKNNTATNSGDSDGQVIKATSLADGITYNISNNNWGEGKTVANDELKDIVIDEGNFEDPEF